MPILDRLPDPSATADASIRLEADLTALVGLFRSLDAHSSDSPLSELFTLFGQLDTHLDIDTNPLTGGLTSAVTSIQNALPANALSYVESLDEAYSDVTDLLSNSDIARQVSEGQLLNEVAQSVIAEALALFDTRIADLTGNLIDPARLEELRSALTLIQNLEDDFAAHQDELLPFLTNHLLGVAPDLLDAPLAHVHTALNVLSPLADSELEVTLDPARQAIITAYRALLDAINDLDPADPTGYAQITLHLDALAAANDLLFTALSTLYTQLENLIAAHAWDTLFTIYVDLLNAVDIGTVPTVDDVVYQLEAMINDLLTRLLMVFDADDLRTRIETLNLSLHDAVISSPLGQIKPTIEAFLERIRQSIEDVPTEEVQTIVNEMLGRCSPIKADFSALSPAAITEQINASFDNVVQTVTVTLKTLLDDLIGIIDEQLRTLRAALEVILDQLKATLATALSSLEAILQQIEGLIFVEILDRLCHVIDNLGVSFDQELDRVRSAFDEMLDAIPLNGGQSASEGISI